MVLLKRWRQLGEKVGLRKRQRISFGLDWGSHSAKFIGLKQVGVRLELTHCLLLDLPDYASPRQIEPIIQNRLEKIRFHGGKLTIALPLRGKLALSSSDGERSSGWRVHLRRIFDRSRRKTGEQPVAEIRLEEKTVRQEWLPRATIRPQDNRLELEGQALGLLLKGQTGRCTAVLNVGKSHSTLSVFSGGEPVHFATLKFSTDHLIDTLAGSEPELRRKVAAYLRSATISTVDGRLQWTQAHGFVDLVPALQGELKSFVDELQQELTSARYPQAVQKLYLAGGGALFPWLSPYLRQVLKIPVQVLRPLSGLLEEDRSSKSAKLRQIEPVFAEAVSLALSGLIAEKRRQADVSGALRWLRPVARKPAQRFRLLTLAILLAVLVAHLGLSWQFDRAFQQNQKNALLLSDLQTEAAALGNLVRFAELRGHQKSPLRRGQSFAAVLQMIGETVSPGTWLTSLEIIPARQVKELRLRGRRFRKNEQALVLHGKAVSGNYVNDFYNRLFQSGYFEQILLKRDDSVEDLSGTISYVILARLRSTP